jgi:glucokinase
MTIDLEGGEPRSLEQLASGLALDASAADVGEPDGKRLIELAESGDEEARTCVAEFGRLMGLGVCTLVDLFNPQRVVLGGGVFDQGTQLLDAIRETVRERVLPPARDDVTVVRSELGSSAGMLGAAIAAFELREHG